LDTNTDKKIMEMVSKITETLENKKAKDIDVIDIRKMSTLADYFIICSGTSVTHIKTLSDELKDKLAEMGLDKVRKEGYSIAKWILMDYGDVVVHIFHEEDRKFYNLERLWTDKSIKKDGKQPEDKQI
jgi:ribosome-associated protein